MGKGKKLTRTLLIFCAELMYSLVPKERHVRKESHDCSLGLCIGCKERHDSTFAQSIDPKERHV